MLPIVLLAVTAVAIMLVVAFYRKHFLAAGLTLVGLLAALVAVWGATPWAPRHVTNLLVIDGYTLFFTGLLVAAALVVAILSYDYLQRHQGNREEFYILLVLATLGSAVLVASNHFASFFLGLEILSVALYGLIAYLRSRTRSIEAGLKYLILAAASAAFLLFGMALIYAALGTMS